MLIMKRTRILLSLLIVTLIVSPVFAGRTIVTHTTVSLTTASQQAVATNVSRNFLIVQNDSHLNDVYCKFTLNAVINEGLRLNLKGGSLFMDVTWPTAALNCMATAVPAKLLIIEGTGP